MLVKGTNSKNCVHLLPDQQRPSSNKFNATYLLLMKAACLLSILLALCLSGLAQVQVNGRLLSPEDQPLAFVPIQLVRDSLPVAGTITDSEGRFSLVCEAGWLNEQASLLVKSDNGTTWRQAWIWGVPTDSVAETGDLRVEEVPVKNLEEVSITAMQTLYERRADRLIFRVENSPLAAGGDGLDALSLTPGVQVTADAISLASRGSVQLTVNDRQIRLSGQELIDYLRALPADNIKSIEVIANPDARFEAEGSAGVINIVLKRPAGEGWDIRTSTTWEQRSKPSLSENLSLHLRHKRLSVYGFYNPRIRQAQTREETRVQYRESSWETNNLRQDRWKNHSYQLGADWELGPRTMLGVVSEGLIQGVNTEDGQAHTDVFSAEGQLDSTFDVQNLIDRNTRYQAWNANLRHELDTAGSTFSADLDYFAFQTDLDQQLATLTSIPGEAGKWIRSESEAPQSIRNLSARFDFSHRLKNGTLGWGARITRTETEADLVFRVWDGSVFQRDPGRSNLFIYTENIQAAYLSWEQSWERSQLELGLRGENTRVLGESVTLDTSSLQQYFRVFPSLFFQQDLGKEHRMNLYYGIRLSRPEFWELNPFKYYLNPYAYSEGNPGLRPSFSHNLELTYSFRNRYSVSLAASATENHFQQLPVIASDEQFFYYTRANVGTQRSLGLSLFAPVEIAKWWQVDLSAWAALNAQTTPYLGEELAYVQPFLWAGVLQRFTISEKRGLSAQLNTTYSTRNQSFLYQTGEVFLVNASLRKEMWEGRGSLALTMYDLFYTFPNRVTVDFADQQMSFFNRPETRYLQVVFNYRFGRDQVRGYRQRSKGNQEERNRSGIR